MSFAAAAAAAFAAAWLGEGRPLAWFSIAAFAGLLSLDEIAMLHERTEEELGGQVIVDYVEPVIAVVALALGVYAARVVTARERVMLLCAISTLAAAVFVGAANSDSISTFIANGLSVLEEALELMVPFFILAAALPAVVAGLRRRYAGRPTGQPQDLGHRPARGAQFAASARGRERILGESPELDLFWVGGADDGCPGPLSAHGSQTTPDTPGRVRPGGGSGGARTGGHALPGPGDVLPA